LLLRVRQVALCATLGGAFYCVVEPLIPHGHAPAEVRAHARFVRSCITV
jgi:hypothetical protein